MPVEKFLTRLQGIGYNGWVTVEWEKAWLPDIAEPEEILPDAIAEAARVDAVRQASEDDGATTATRSAARHAACGTLHD